jgi:hypothetical protein
MPGIRIPTYQSQVNTPLQASGADTPLATVQDNTGQAIQGIGQDISQVAGVLELQQRQDAQASVARQIGDDKVKWLQYVQQAKDTAAPGAPDFTPSLLNNFDDYAQESLDKMQDGPAKRFYADHLTSFRTSLATEAVTWQAQQHRAYNVDQYQQGNDSAARVVAMDPSQYGTTRAQQLALIDASSLDAPTKAKLVDNFKDTASTAVGTRMTNENPQAAYAALTQKPDQPLPDGYQWVGDLPPQKLTVLQQHALTLIQQQQNAVDRAQQAREAQASSSFNAAFDVLSKGQNLSPQALTDLQTATKGTSVESDANALIKTQATGAQFGSQSLPQQASTLERMRAAAADPKVGVDPVESKVLAQYEQIHSSAVDAYKKNPWEAAQAYGVTQNAPIAPIQSVDDAVAVANSRAQAQGVVEQAAGRKVSPFQPAEAQQLAGVLEALPVDQRGAAISQLGRTMQDPSRAADFAKQIGDTHRPLYLQLMQGSINATTVGGYPVATLIAQGEQAIKDKTAGIDDKVQEGARAQIAKAVRGTFASGVQDQDAVDSAYYIYAALSARDKVAPQAVDSDKVKLAVDSATGGLTSFNGKSTAKPYGWDDDRFNNAVKAVTPASVQTQIPDGNVHFGKTNIPVADFIQKIPGAQLVRVAPEGSYAVVAGTGYATNSQGQPVILKLK